MPMAMLVAMLKCLAEETRLRILRLVTVQELAVNELVDTLSLPQPRVSRHLAVLRRVGLVRDRRDGNLIYYRASADEMPPPAGPVWRAVHEALADGPFHPGDLTRLEATLARRGARSRGYFDDVLAEWDRIRRSYIDDALSASITAGLVPRGAVAADIGTGTGRLLPWLAKAASRVIAVDRSERMLAVCRERLAREGLANVELRAGEAEALPLADGECDVVFSSMLLHHLADPAAGAREMARIVRPGGRLVVSDLAKHEEDWTREVMADLWLGFAEAQVRQWLAAAGLTDVTYTCKPARPGRRAGAMRKLPAFLATGIRTSQPWSPNETNPNPDPNRRT